MDRRTPRLLLAASAAIFLFGGIMHALAYATKALPAIDASNLQPFLRAEVKGLWLADSTTLLALAFLIGFVAARPQAVAGTAVVLVALIPAGTTVLLYLFLGPFYAGHMLLAASAMIALAGLLMARGRESVVRFTNNGT